MGPGAGRGPPLRPNGPAKPTERTRPPRAAPGRAGPPEGRAASEGAGGGSPAALRVGVRVWRGLGRSSSLQSREGARGGDRAASGAGGGPRGSVGPRGRESSRPGAGLGVPGGRVAPRVGLRGEAEEAGRPHAAPASPAGAGAQQPGPRGRTWPPEPRAEPGRQVRARRPPQRPGSRDGGGGRRRGRKLRARPRCPLTGTRGKPSRRPLQAPPSRGAPRPSAGTRPAALEVLGARTGCPALLLLVRSPGRPRASALPWSFGCTLGAILKNSNSSLICFLNNDSAIV